MSARRPRQLLPCSARSTSQRPATTTSICLPTDPSRTHKSNLIRDVDQIGVEISTNGNGQLAAINAGTGNGGCVVLKSGETICSPAPFGSFTLVTP